MFLVASKITQLDMLVKILKQLVLSQLNIIYNFIKQNNHTNFV